MAKKELTPDEISLIAKDLNNKLSGKRRSAAKKIGRHKLTQLGEDLYNAYIREREDKRTWETQTEMILALGRIGYPHVLPELRSIIEHNEPHDMITIAAARSYVRLKRKDINDATPVIELLEFGNLSVLNGALDILAFDNMEPCEEEIRTIITLLNGKNERDISISGLGDPREPLISAMSRWKDPASRDYLTRFSASQNRTLRESAEAALAGKRSVYE